MDKRKGFAERLLWLWGDQMRVRLADSTPYVGNIDAGAYRPDDDPHPHAFIVVQVERCLSDLGEKHRAYAWHRFVERESARSYDDRRRFREGLMRDIVESLAIRIEGRRFETLVDKNAAEIAAELRRLRGAIGGRPKENHAH